MQLFTIAKYAGYLLQSGHYRGHKIHSPFIFDLVSRIFQNKTDPEIVFKIETIRKKMINDPRSIIVNDLGSSSKKMKSGLRKVSDIAKYSAIPKKYGLLLSRLSSVFGKPLIVEFGTSLGISTMYMAASCRDAFIYTLEGCQLTSELARENFREAGLSNITVLNGRFDDLLPEIKNLNTCPGLVFIDGNHRKEPTINYFNQIAEIAGNDTVVVLDDIYHSVEMYDAWQLIKKDKKVTAAVDIFKMGIVFFREGMTPCEYVVRY